MRSRKKRKFVECLQQKCKVSFSADFVDFLCEYDGVDINIGEVFVSMLSFDESSLMCVNNYLKYRVGDWIPIGIMNMYNERDDLVYMNFMNNQIWAKGKKMIDNIQPARPKKSKGGSPEWN